MNSTIALVGIVVEAALACMALLLGETAGHHARFDTKPRRLATFAIAWLCMLTGIITPVISGMINDGGIRLYGSIGLMIISLGALRIPHCSYRHGRQLRLSRRHMT